MNGEVDRHWRPIDGYESRYEVSDDGLVKSLAGPGRNRPNTDRILKHQLLPAGYHYVNLYDDAGKAHHRYVHHLILEAFVGPRPVGGEGLHWDDDKDNNTIQNLRWDTRSNNQRDAVRNGTHANAGKTHCPRGHPYSGDNLIVHSKGRACRACAHEWARLRRRAAGIPELKPAESGRR